MPAVRGKKTEDFGFQPDDQPSDLGFIPDQSPSSPDQNKDQGLTKDQVDAANRAAYDFDPSEPAKPKTPAVPKLPIEPPTVAGEIARGLPQLAKETVVDAAKQTGAAAAYEAAAAVRGASLGYLDPTSWLEKTPLANQPISKPIAEGAGAFAGAAAPITAAGHLIGPALRTTGLLEGVRPILQNLVQAGVTGAVYGAAEKPPEENLAARAHDALSQAAAFITLTGAGHLVDQAATAMGLNKAGAYANLRKAVVQRFRAAGAAEDQANTMADVGIRTAVKQGGGWADVTAGDLRQAQDVVKNGGQIVLNGLQKADPGAVRPTQPQIEGSAAPPATPPPEPGAPPPAAGPLSPPPDEPPAAPAPLTPQADQYLQSKFPDLRAAVVAAAPHIPPEAVHPVATEAAAKGEEALIAGASPEQANAMSVQAFKKAVQAVPAKPPQQVTTPELPRPDNMATVPIDQIQFNPEKYQLREKTDPDRARAIAENFDPTQDRPVILRALTQGGFELLDGHHRVMAAQMRGAPAVNAIIYDNLSDEKAQEIARRGNAQAVGYTPLEEAKIFGSEVERGKNLAQIGKDYGNKTPAYVQSVMNLNHLSGEIQQLIRDNALDTKTGIVLGKAVQEFGIPPEIQSEIYHRFIKEYQVTPGQLAQTLRVFGPKILEQGDFFGQLQGTEGKRGFMSVMKETLDQIRAAEREAAAYKKVIAMIDAQRKAGIPIAKKLIDAYGSMKKVIAARQEDLSRLQKSIGQEKLPTLRRLSKKAETAKKVAAQNVVEIPEDQIVPELPAGRASMSVPGGTVVFNSNRYPPEMIQSKVNDGSLPELFGEESGTADRQEEMFGFIPTGGQAKPQFEVPDSAFASLESQQYPASGYGPEAAEQRPLAESDLPEALTESVVVNRLRDVGHLDLTAKSLQVTSPRDIAGLFWAMKEHTVESAYVVFLDEFDKILAVQMVGMGTVNASIVDPRNIVSGARLIGARNIVMIHNHPSMNPTPSSEDFAITERVKKSARLLGMDVKYHVIIDGDKFGYIDGETLRSEILPDHGPNRGPVKVRMVQPVKSGVGQGVIDSPESAIRLAKGMMRGRSGTMVISIDTRNQVSAVHVVPGDVKGGRPMAAEMAKIAIRSNATNLIVVSSDLPVESVRTANQILTQTIGVPILDGVATGQGPAGYVSMHEMGLLRDSPRPYGEVRDSGPEMSPEVRRALNKKIARAQIIRAEIGMDETAWTNLKIQTVGKASLAEMDADQIGRVIYALQKMKLTADGKFLRPPEQNPDVVRRRLDINDTAYKAIQTQIFGEERADKSLSAEDRKKLLDKLAAYPQDIRGKAVVWDLPAKSGLRLDKDFAFGVAHYHDLNGYEMRYLDQPRALKVVDPTGNLKRLTYDQIQDAVKTEMDMVDSIRRRLSAVAGKIKMGSEGSARAMRFGEGRATPDDLEKITPQEKNLATFLRQQYDTLRDFANDERRRFGKPEIPYRKNYFTHMWEQNTWDTFLQGILLDRAMSLAESDYTKPNAPFNPYELARRGKDNFKDDAIGVFDRYLNTILKDALYRGPIKQIRMYIHHLPGNTGRFLSRFADDMAGKTSAMDRFGVIPEEIINALVWLGQRATANALVLNFNFMVTNLCNPAITVGQVGPLWTLAGARFFLSSKGLNFAWKASSLLRSRTNIFEMDYSRMDAVEKYLTGNFIEYFNVGSAFCAGYLKAKDAGKTEKEAVDYGDDVAAKTQADYRKHALSPFLRSKAGKVFGKLQTYPFNLMHFMVYDLLEGRVGFRGTGEAKSSKFNRLGKVMGLLTAVYFVNKLHEFITGKPAYDVGSWFPALPFLPHSDARPPVGFVPFDVLQKFIRAYGASEKNEKRDWAEAKKSLEDAAFLFIPPAGGVQIQRLIHGHVFPAPKVKETVSGIAAGGLRDSGLKEGGMSKGGLK